MLPDSGALRWRLRSARGQRIDASDVDLLAEADRLILFAGKVELLGPMWADALGDLHAALAANPDRAFVYLARGTVRDTVRRHGGGGERLQRAWDLDRDDPVKALLRNA